MRLLLASQSTARRAMLEAAGISFETVAGPLDEEGEKAALRDAGANALVTAERLAQAKALAIVAPAAGAFVLGCDQTLELADGGTLDKARSREEMADQLARMSGTAHWLHSAAACVRDGQVIWRATESVRMHMRPLSAGFIRSYLEREYEFVRWNVGGYRIEGEGVQLFERIEGSHHAILGLPLLPLLAFLREQGSLAS